MIIHHFVYLLSDVQRTTMKLASLAFIAGYLVKLTMEKTSCLSCIESVAQSECISPLYSLIANEDRGGLKYPQANFVVLLSILQEFVENALPYLPEKYPLQIIKKYVEPNIRICPIFCCPEPSHTEVISKLILDKFLPILLKNIAKCVTDKVQSKIFYKPLNRKVRKL